LNAISLPNKYQVPGFFLEALARVEDQLEVVSGDKFLSMLLEIAMLNDPQIQTLMKRIAAGVLPGNQLVEVRSEPTVDADGKDALRITLVISDEAANTLTGEQLSSLLLDIHDCLLNEGDERFPLIYYATPDDLDESNSHIDED
jgi:hypothetical protein